MVESMTTQASDERLLASVRAGDADAFGELWRRHSRSGLTVARRFTSSLDPDDLVAEAFVRIYQSTVAGGGPSGAFRPYLYATIRNLACTWGRTRRELAVDDLADVADPSSLDDRVELELDSSLTADAFRALPERWQTVLWYTEVEGMDPHEVAPLLGLSPNGAAALAYRAREGLRSSWLQAHVTDATASGSCRWTIERLGGRARHGLSKRERARVEEHLGVCRRCSSIAEEVDDVGARIAAIAVPLMIGGGIGGSVVAGQLAHPGAAMASAAGVGAASSAPTAVVVSAATSAALAGAASAPASVMAGLLVAAVVAGSALVGVAAPSGVPPSAERVAASVPEPAAGSIERAADEPADPADARISPEAAPKQPAPNALPPGVAIDQIVGPVIPTPTIPTPAIPTPAIPTPVSATVDGVNDLVGEVVAPVQAVLPLRPGPPPAHTAPAGPVGTDLRLDLSGTGMPGATVSAQASGVVYGTAVVSSSGSWALRTSVLPGGIPALQLSQRLTVLGIAVPVDVPLTLLSDTLGIHVELL